MAQYDVILLQVDSTALKYDFRSFNGTAGGLWGFNPTTRIPEVCTFGSYDTNGDLTIADGNNVIINTTIGTKLGTGATQKLGFWNATPVVQPTAVADAAGGGVIDAEARTALNNLLARLRTIGIVAT